MRLSILLRWLASMLCLCHEASQRCRSRVDHRTWLPVTKLHTPRAIVGANLSAESGRDSMGAKLPTRATAARTLALALVMALALEDAPAGP
jgi:hypothetical protein